MSAPPSAPRQAPKPEPRPDRVSMWRYLRLFRADLLSAQPERLYRARMAEYRTPFFSSYLVNEPDLIDLVLRERPDDFPKSGRVSEGLRPLLGNSVFLTNGALWKRQRRIIDPAFEGGRLRDTFPAMDAAARLAVERLHTRTGEVLDFEPVASHAAADVIFRTLFSIPIDHEVATRVFADMRGYQHGRPLLNLAAFIRLPRWMPRFFSPKALASARRIRQLIRDLTAERARQLQEGTAPNDLATKIMTQTDPETGERFDTEEMVDQVAIFFLAGHETSASALGWALYLLAISPEWQEKVAREAAGAGAVLNFTDLRHFKLARDVFREALRLYPPVPMMVRQTTRPECFRKRDVKQGAQVVLSPWHLQRHQRHWDSPDNFDPGRWQRAEGKEAARCAYMPFSAGPRVCPGAGFAMAEGTLLLVRLMQNFNVTAPETAPEPIPAAHLTVRSKTGIWLEFTPRNG